METVEEPEHTRHPKYAKKLVYSHDTNEGRHVDAPEYQENNEDADVLSCMSPPFAHYFVDNPGLSKSAFSGYLETINIEREKIVTTYRNLLEDPKKNIIALQKLYQTPLLHKIILWEEGKWQGVDDKLGPSLLAEYKSNFAGGWSKMSDEYTVFVKVLDRVPDSTIALI